MAGALGNYSLTQIQEILQAPYRYSSDIVDEARKLLPIKERLAPGIGSIVGPSTADPFATGDHTYSPLPLNYGPGRDAQQPSGALPTQVTPRSAPPGPMGNPKGKARTTAATPALVADRMVGDFRQDSPVVAATPALEAEQAPVATPTATFDSASPVPMDMGPDHESETRRKAPWLAMAAAGFGMLASKNPRFLGALGEGGQDALKVIDKSADSARREALVKLERQQHAETARRNKAIEVLERDKMAQQKDLETKALRLKELTIELEAELNPAKKAKLEAEKKQIEAEVEIKLPAYAEYLRGTNRAQQTSAAASMLNARTNADASKMSTSEGLIQWATEVERLENSKDPAERRRGELLKQHSPVGRNQLTAESPYEKAKLKLLDDPNFLEMKPEDQDKKLRALKRLYPDTKESGPTNPVLTHDKYGNRIK